MSASMSSRGLKWQSDLEQKPAHRRLDAGYAVRLLWLILGIVTNTGAHSGSGKGVGRPSGMTPADIVSGAIR